MPLKMHKRAPLELDTETVMDDHLKKYPRGTSLLKSRAKRAFLPVDQTDTDNKTPGMPSLPCMLGIRPTSESARALGAYPSHPYQKNMARRRCHWADHGPLPASGLGHEAQGLVDANGTLPTRSEHRACH